MPTQTQTPMIVELRHDEFATLLADAESPLLVHFWAPWCAPCMTLKPIFEQAATMHRELRFASCNIEAEPQLMQALAIRDLPTLVLYQDCGERARISGTMRLGALLDWLVRQRTARPRRLQSPR